MPRWYGKHVELWSRELCAPVTCSQPRPVVFVLMLGTSVIAILLVIGLCSPVVRTCVYCRVQIALWTLYVQISSSRMRKQAGDWTIRLQ
jgi:hypothetical protein